MKVIKVFSVFIFISSKILAQSVLVNGPAGSGAFSNAIVVLTNGNYVVTDPLYDEAGIQDIGALYLYNGETHALISTLKGSTTGDKVGGGGALVLNNGNFVVYSANWSNGGTTGVGAVTWVNGTTGLNATVNSTNSLVGSTTADFASSSILALSNGNYIVRCPNWDNGGIIDAGAVAWGNGNTGLKGTINSTNSLVGSMASDNIGNGGVKIISNGNYLIISTNWDNAAATNTGAVTWGNGNGGPTGPITSTNSLIGSATNDRVGNEVFVLKNNNYVVLSRYWSNGANQSVGAATWGNGSTGTSGIVSASNSLVGSTTNDQIGSDEIFELANSNFIVKSFGWDNGAAIQAGAITWVNGATGKTGVVSSSNSLVGSTSNDKIGNSGIIELTNGNYVVNSREWNNGAITDAGAVTWANGSTGISGIVTSTNSLVGTSASDQVGFSPTVALSNGNYVVGSPFWKNGTFASAGAATWCNGTTGRTGDVTTSNSLVGSKANDQVGNVRALSNGNYVVRTVNWDNGSTVDVGAATWGNGLTGIFGTINSTNSLIGSTASDQLGSNGITELSNGNYVVISPNVDNGTTTNTGAITWGNGGSGIIGLVGSTSSLIGSTASDQVGSSGIVTLPNGHYVVRSPNWDSGLVTNAGAVTWVNGSMAIVATVSSLNSLIGSTASDQIGSSGIEVLSNNNYVVRSQNWDNAGITNIGAITWGNGSTGTQGIVSASNSLVGSTANDQIGSTEIITLVNGNYVVRSLNWDNGAATNAGAVTWGNGSTGISGVINATNSLVGSTALDQIGSSGVFGLINGNYVVTSSGWDNGPIVNAAAATWGNGSLGTIGTINSCNSILGNIASSTSFSVNYDDELKYYLIGKPDENRYYIFNPAGQQLAPNLATVTATVSGINTTAPLVTNNCQIIASITPTAGNPVDGQITAKIWLEASQNASFVKRHYEITPAQNAATATGKVTLYFTQNDFNDFNAANSVDLPQNSNDNSGKANLRITKYPGTSNNSTGLPNSYTGSPTTIDPADSDIVYNSLLSRWEVSFNVTGFSGFLVTSQSNPLPLNLLSFTGKNENGTNILNWQTANEVNFSHFEIERSPEASVALTPRGGNSNQKFEKIGEKSNNESGIYQFQDSSSPTGGGGGFYRLRILDLDGSFTFSKIIYIENKNEESGISIYPNPSSQYFQLSKNTDIKSIEMVDMSGKIIKKMNYSADNHYTVSDLPKGIYHLKLNMDGKIKISKMAIN